MDKFNPMNELSLVKVLYVEDDDDIRDEIVDFLELEVGELIVATNGEEGLEKFLRHSPDVVITDIQMPIMDGLKMAEEIKKIEKSTPIIVTTAFNENDYLLKSINIGIDKYVLKPIDLTLLMDSIFKSVENKILQDKLKAKKEYINFILDTTPSFMVVTTGEDLEYINKTLLSYLGYQTIAEFKNSHSCLEDFFCRSDGLKYDEVSGKSWIQHIIENPEIDHIAYLCNRNFENCAIKPYLIKYNAFAKFNKYVFSFTDISGIKIDKPFFKGENKSAGINDCYSKREIDLLLFSESEKAKKYDGKLSIALIDFEKEMDVKLSTEIKMYIYENIEERDIIAKVDSHTFVILLAGIEFENAKEQIDNLTKKLKDKFNQIEFQIKIVNFRDEKNFEELKKKLIECKL